MLYPLSDYTIIRNGRSEELQVRGEKELKEEIQKTLTAIIKTLNLS
jgi:hypothetical protein